MQQEPYKKYSIFFQIIFYRYIYKLIAKFTQMWTPKTNDISMPEYFRKKQKIKLNEKLNEYFSILQKVTQGVRQSSQSNIVSSELIKAFQELSKNQQTRYLIQNIQYISKAVNNRIQKRASLQSNYTEAFNDSKSIETTCQMGKKKLLVCFKVMYTFLLDKNKKSITVEAKKNAAKVYDLRKYLVKKSRKQKYQIILIPAFTNQKKQQVLFNFSPALADRIYQEVWNCIISYRNQELLYLLSTKKDDKYQEKYGRVFLNSRNFKSLMNFKQKAISQTKAVNQKWVTLYEKKKTNGESYMVLQNRQKQQHIKLEAIIQKNIKQVKKQFLQMMDEPLSRCSLVKQACVLEQYQQIYQAIHQRLVIHGHNFQLLFLKDTYPTKNQLNNKSHSEDIIFLKGIDNILVINFLQFMLVSVIPIAPNVSKLTIYGSFNLNHIINPKLARMYLLSLVNQYQQNQNKYETKQQQQQQDKIVSSNNLMKKQIQSESDSDIISNQHQIFFDFGDPDEDCQQLFSIMNQSFSIQSQQKRQTNRQIKKRTDSTTVPRKVEQSPLKNSIIKHKYQVSPIKNYNLQKNIQTQHFLFKDWKRRKNGGVTCVNEQLMEKQRKIFKQVLTSMGSQVLKGGNILNVSLPVTIFKKQSHIQSIAKNMVYAPLLLENRKDNLERMKYTILFALSFGTTGISLDKPFFTFLGQTVQYWIGGCPVYVEQITRYPPVSAYLFIGRGYRIHGQVDPKINFGINGVKGYSQRPIYIEYDDGTVIQYICGKMLISNLFFGQRQFNFYDQIYVFDKTHNLFAELTFGPKQKKIFNKNSHPSDFYSGRICQVSPDFKDIFDKQMPRQYPTKKYIIKQISLFEGIWCDKAYFDGKEYFDFKNQLPCRYQIDQNPLPSDSSFRPQLIKLIEGDMQQSQRLKVMAEEDQRRDRKLRKKTVDNKG